MGHARLFHLPRGTCLRCTGCPRSTSQWSQPSDPNSVRNRGWHSTKSYGVDRLCALSACKGQKKNHQRTSLILLPLQILHVDHWHCSGKADGADETDDDASSDEVISDTGGEGCVQHGTHYHCPAGVSAPCTAHLDDYDLGLHIGALFVLLVASGLGVLTPVMLKDAAVKNSKVAGLFFVRFF